MIFLKPGKVSDNKLWLCRVAKDQTDTKMVHIVPTGTRITLQRNDLWISLISFKKKRFCDSVFVCCASFESRRAVCSNQSWEWTCMATLMGFYLGLPWTCVWPLSQACPVWFWCGSTQWSSGLGWSQRHTGSCRTCDRAVATVYVTVNVHLHSAV